MTFHPKGQARFVDGHVRMGLSNELNAASSGFRTVAASAKYHNLPIILSEADPEGCAACSAKENPANGVPQWADVSRLHGGGDEGADRSGGRSRR